MAARQQAGFSNVVRGDEELGKYQNKYEESMNPFEAFRGRVSLLLSVLLVYLTHDLSMQERGRAHHNLNVLEKVLLSLSTVVLSNRITRNLFILYSLGLHFVVFSQMYAWTVVTGEAGKSPLVQPDLVGGDLGI